MLSVLDSEIDYLIDVDLIEIIKLFSTGICCGIVFSTLIFILSVLINAFFDIVKK